ncbi:MAG: TetR/AcrR family transcriptional regulator [Chloroflexi bacterium]|nr:TetR/AcrR family transcriptional regulator [Chloroflexota bacterium]
MNGDHEDRRVRRTRRLLRESLLALILEKGYDKVTVQDVLDRADVGRATFYAHFHDKDDLLVSGIEELVASLRQHLAVAARAGSHESHAGFDLARALFEHAAAHRRPYRAHVSGRAGAVLRKYAHEQFTTLLREHLHDVASTHGATPVVPLEVTVQYFASALLGVLTWWLDNETQYSAEEMGNMFLHLAKPTFAAAFAVTADIQKGVSSDAVTFGKELPHAV